MPTYAIDALAGQSYFSGVDTPLDWDDTTEIGASAEIYFDSGLSTQFIQVAADLTFTGQSAFASWSPGVAAGTVRLTVEFYSDVFSLIDSATALNSGSGSIFLPFSGPVNVPAGGLIRVVVHNSSGTFLTGGGWVVLDWAATPPATAHWRIGRIGWPT